MRDGDFEIDGNFYGRTHNVAVEAVEPGAPEWRTQDAPNPVGDDMFLGRDYLTPTAWTLKLWTFGTNTTEARAALAGLAAVWNRPVRTPGVEQVLRYQVDGQVMRLFGRCRGVGFDPNRTLRQGKVPATAVFAARDALVYEEPARGVELSLLPPTTNTVPLPSPLPLVFGPSGPRSGTIEDVGGNTPTPVRIRVHGPLLGRWAVTVAGHRVEMNHTLAYDRFVTIDTRTRTVLGDDGANLGGKLSRKVFLPDVLLPPGAAEVAFEGNDDTGTSLCEVGWYPAVQGF